MVTTGAFTRPPELLLALLRPDPAGRSFRETVASLRNALEELETLSGGPFRGSTQFDLAVRGTAHVGQDVQEEHR